MANMTTRDALGIVMRFLTTKKGVHLQVWYYSVQVDLFLHYNSKAIVWIDSSLHQCALQIFELHWRLNPCFVLFDSCISLGIRSMSKGWSVWREEHYTDLLHYFILLIVLRTSATNPGAESASRDSSWQWLTSWFESLFVSTFSFSGLRNMVSIVEGKSLANWSRPQACW